MFCRAKFGELIIFAGDDTAHCAPAPATPPPCRRRTLLVVSIITADGELARLDITYISRSSTLPFAFW